MKKYVALLLALLLTLVLIAGCAKEEPVDTLYDENMPNKLLASQVTEFPMATDATTYEQRRQMCLDFFRLSIEFQWKPNVNVEDYVSYYKGTTKGLLTENLYAGIPYGGTSSGSIYRWLEYYDETTGIMDLKKAFEENGGWGEGAYVDRYYKTSIGQEFPRYRSMMALFNQCSSAPGWAWARVINTARFGMTKHTNVYNGYIPVGCYTYGYEYEGKQYDMTTIDVFGSETENNPLGYDTKDVIADLKKEKGPNAMYECYAQMKPGDCLVSGGHQLMVVSVNFFKTSDGKIDYSLSSVTVGEQIDAWGKRDEINGTKLYQSGRMDSQYLFSYLEEEKYIPFTFVELLDPANEQDKKHLDFYNSYADKLTAVQNSYSKIAFSDEMNGAGIEKGQVYNSLGRSEGKLSFAELKEMAVASNYSVSDVFVIVTDKDGNQLLKNIWRSECYHSREIPMTATRSTFDKDGEGNLSTLYADVEALAGQGNTIEISLQIATGEKLTAFKGELTS